MTRRAMTTMALVAIALAGIAVSAGAAGSNDLDARPARDGTYIGFVRTVAGGADTLAIDIPNDHGPEFVVHAGGLAQLDIVGPAPRPFRIIIKSGAMVGLMTADDALTATSRAATEHLDPRRARRYEVPRPMRRSRP